MRITAYAKNVRRERHQPAILKSMASLNPADLDLIEQGLYIQHNLSQVSYLGQSLLQTYASWANFNLLLLSYTFF